MKQRHHLIYGSLIAVLVVILLYEHINLINTRLLMAEEINMLNLKLNSSIDKIYNSLEQLKGSDISLENRIFNIGSELNKSSNLLQNQLTEVKTQNTAELNKLQENIDKLKLTYSDFSNVIEDSIPAVVSVRTNTGLGSGFIISPDGYIVTNYHVIRSATAASVVTSDGNSHSVRIVGYSPDADIAVIQIEAEDLKYLSFSSSVSVGEKVIAIGSPGGLDFTVTEGIVSAVNRKDSKGNQYIQIDVAINPGNSGGPLIDAEGNVVGITTLKIAGFEGLGFALSADYADDIVSSILSKQ